MKIKCPRCGNPGAYDNTNPWRPFCSERCKLIDLGEWVTEKNRIPAEDIPDESLSGDSGIIKH